MKRTKNCTVCVRLFALGFMIALFVITGCKDELKPKPPQAVKAMQITSPDDIAQRTFPGRAAAGKEVNLSFRVSGILDEFPVNPGDKVKAGDILASLDTNDFIVRLNSARSVLNGAEAAYARAEADFNRLSRARKEDPGAVSQRAVDAGRAARDETRAAVSAAKANVQTLADRLSYTRLQAPFDGEIVATYVKNFENIVAKQPILRLLDPSSIEMTLAIPENLIGYVRYITDIKVTFDNLPGVSIAGHITEIGRESSQSTHTYPLTITMAQPENGEIIPGMAGEASIQAKLPEQKRSGIHVPSTALFAGTDATKSYVWIVSEDTLERRQVEVGALTGSGMTVLAGLNQGEWIVSAGVSSLTEGQKVRIINKGEAP